MIVERLTKDQIKESIVSKLQRHFGCETSDVPTTSSIRLLPSPSAMRS